MTSANKRNFTVANYATLSTISNPIEGDRAWLEDVKAWYTFDSTSWGRIGPLVGETNLSIDTTSIDVIFSIPLSNASYVAYAQIINTVDTDTQFIPVTVTQKFTSGFTAKWNDVLDSGNYKLDWLVSGV